MPKKISWRKKVDIFTPTFYIYTSPKILKGDFKGRGFKIAKKLWNLIYEQFLLETNLHTQTWTWKCNFTNPYLIAQRLIWWKSTLIVHFTIPWHFLLKTFPVKLWFSIVMLNILWKYEISNVEKSLWWCFKCFINDALKGLCPYVPVLDWIIGFL